MKPSLVLFGVASALFLGPSIPIHAQDANVWRPGWMWDSTMLRQVNLRLENAKTSDQLIALAKASDLNIFADATLFSASSQPVAVDTENYLRSWILETASVEGLSWRRSNERTLLFWQEPDVRAVVKELIAETKEQTIVPIPDKPVTKEASLLASMSRSLKQTQVQEAELFLAGYLQQKQGWDGKSSLQLEFKLSELPPQATAELLNIARSTLTGSKQNNQRRWREDAAWLSDELWQDARLDYSQPPGLPKAILAVLSAKGNVQKFAGLEGLTVFSSPVIANPERAKTALTQPVTKEFPNLTGEELAKQEALAQPVSLEVKEVALSDLLSEAQKQSGVTLKTSPSLPSDQRITARASALPLHQIMNALSGLYGTGWAKAPDGFYLMQSELSPARVAVLQVGDTQWFEYWRSPTSQKTAPDRLTLDQPVDWGGELLEAGLDEATLRAPNGVAISALPTELQSLVRRAVEERYALDLIRKYDDAFADLPVLLEGREEDILVQVEPSKGQATTRRGAGPLINTSPLLKVSLVEGGKSVYQFSVHGPQARQGIQEMVRRSRKQEETMHQMLERRNGAGANG